MVSPAVTMPRPSQQPGAAGRTKDVVPFIRATKKHYEPFFDATYALGANQTVIPPVSVPAYGFLRGVWVRVDATGGTGTAAVASQNAPFNALANIALQDVNGAPLIGPFDGYRAFEITKYGGYHRSPDPRQGAYSAPSTAGNFGFWLYLPIELVRRSGLGALANLNAAATYKIFATINNTAGIFSTPPTGLPNVRVRLWLDAWSQPPGSDLLGNMTDQLPPNHGTTQFWSEQVYPITAGSQTIRLQRVGLYIRNLIVTLYNSSGARDDADWPDPLSLYLDGYELQNKGQSLFKQEMAQLYAYSPNSLDAANTLDTGVYVYNFVDDDSPMPGMEERNRYLTTLQSSRLELRGTFGGSVGAGTLSVLTNDVSPAGDVFVPAGVIL